MVEKNLRRSASDTRGPRAVVSCPKKANRVFVKSFTDVYVAGAGWLSYLPDTSCHAPCKSHVVWAVAEPIGSEASSTAIGRADLIATSLLVPESRRATNWDLVQAGLLFAGRLRATLWRVKL